MKTRLLAAFAALTAMLCFISGVVAQSRTTQQPHRAVRHRPNPNIVPRLHPFPDFGDPLPGLNLAQLAAFSAGLDEFENVETVASGLGPIFNNVSCVACHSSPAVGGGSDIVVTRFGRVVNGVFDPLAEKGGSLLQEFSIDPLVREVVPPEANVIAHRRTTPLFGLGLIEAIPDAAIRDLASRPKPDGVVGRVSEITDITTGLKRVGRFGWKAQQATLLAFSADAYLNEMGITSRFFPNENAPNGNAILLALFDTTVDPEDQVDPATNRSDIDAAADFMRFLGAPPRLPLTPGGAAGQLVFNQVGCAVCHTPLWQTGTNSVAALDRKPVWLFSDLLLHDMGSLGDGIAQASAGMREMRTAPLWGLRGSTSFLHDGRAKTVDEAIAAHDGEGRVSRDRYLRLTPQQRRQLLEFLNSI